MSVIWPGLDLLIKLYVARQTKGGIRYEYPFRIYPPPSDFDRGTFSQEMMDKVSALWKRLRPKSKTGGRVQMDTVEIRPAIFAVRAYEDYLREGMGTR
jgi:hypothetical protein